MMVQLSKRFDYIPKMFQAPIDQKRFLGHFFIAIKIDSFQNPILFKKRLSQMMQELRDEPPQSKDVSVQVAGDPEKMKFKERVKKGIPLKKIDLKLFEQIKIDYKVNVDFSL